MSSYDKNNINTSIPSVTVKNISKNEQQAILLFDTVSDCDENELEEIHKTIVGKILCERDVIVVTKGYQLMDLISDAVGDIEQSYIKENAIRIKSFVPEPESKVKHHATLVKKFPLCTAKDIASSCEFTCGNLWFLIPSIDANIDQIGSDMINDIRKLSVFKFKELPVLKNETVVLPAGNDGIEILWFKPNHNVYEKEISSPH